MGLQRPTEKLLAKASQPPLGKRERTQREATAMLPEPLGDSSRRFSFLETDQKRVPFLTFCSFLEDP